MTCRTVTRYDLISCVNCSLVNCRSHSFSELVAASVCREATLSLSLRRPPRAMVAMVMVTGHRNWLAHDDSQCPMNALHFHTSPGGQRERLTRLFNPRSSYLLRSACPRFVSFRFVSDSPKRSRRTLSLISTLPHPIC